MVESLGKTSQTQDILAVLHQLSDPAQVVYRKEKFGIAASGYLGITQSNLNEIVRAIGKNSKRAIELFHTGVYEARILTAKTFAPRDLEMKLVETWVPEFENWEICDTFSMKLFAHSKIANEIIQAFAPREGEFERRTAFATLAGLCSSDKVSPNSVFLAYSPLLIEYSSDSRIYVKKAISWALRSIGKRNPDLRMESVQVAREIFKGPSSSAQWIAKDALKELEADKLRISNYPRSQYAFES